MRRIGIAIAAGLALVFGALPATAAAPDLSSSITGAEAVWYIDQGGVASAVLIRPVQERDGGANHNLIVGVNVQVEQAYTDPATGEDVFRLLGSEPYYAPAKSISVDRLKGATVQATVNLFDTASGEGPYTLTIAADWTPVGDTTHSFSNVWDTEGGFWSLKRFSSMSVPAIATATVTGAFDYGALGEAQGVLATGRDFAKLPKPPVPDVLLAAMMDVYAAEGRTTSHISGAVASWQVGDTFVSLDVTQNHTAAGKGSQPGAALTVYGGYHDPATNEDVWFSVGGEGDVPTGVVDPSMQSARVSVTIMVSGFEERTPVGSGQPTQTDIGPFPITVSADWTATGAITHWRKLFLEKAPDYTSKDRFYSRARLAAATGTISGSIINAQLVNVQNAFMYDESSTVTVK